MGINELPITKKFMQEHGEKKKKMKVSWAEYLTRLEEERKKKSE